MIINPFTKERTRKKLMNFLPVLDEKCDKISTYVKKHVDIIEVDEEFSQKLKIEKGTEVILIKDKKREKLLKLIEDFEYNKNIALGWLEDIRPYLLEDGNCKDIYAICDSRIAETLSEYNKVISFMNEYEILAI